MTTPQARPHDKRNLVGDEIASLVPDKSNYGQAYLRQGRMFSFAHQVEEVLAFQPKRVLEVGPGPGIVTHALRTGGVEVITADVEETLKPDLLASVTDLPLNDGAVEVAICCQVLEHLPFDRFETALGELRRVTSRRLVLSLPDSSRYLEIGGYLPKMKRFRWSWSARGDSAGPIPSWRTERMGHYWEIGFQGTGLNTVTRAIRTSGWQIDRTWRVPELPWHRFFSLTKGDTV